MKFNKLNYRACGVFLQGVPGDFKLYAFYVAYRTWLGNTPIIRGLLGGIFSK